MPDNYCIYCVLIIILDSTFLPTLFDVGCVFMYILVVGKSLPHLTILLKSYKQCFNILHEDRRQFHVRYLIIGWSNLSTRYLH